MAIVEEMIISFECLFIYEAFRQNCCHFHHCIQSTTLNVLTAGVLLCEMSKVIHAELCIRWVLRTRLCVGMCGLTNLQDLFHHEVLLLWQVERLSSHFGGVSIIWPTHHHHHHRSTQSHPMWTRREATIPSDAMRAIAAFSLKNTSRDGWRS